jgi:hypothetical protein
MPFQALPITGSAVSEEEGIGLAETEELKTVFLVQILTPQPQYDRENDVLF